MRRQAPLRADRACILGGALLGRLGVALRLFGGSFSAEAAAWGAAMILLAALALAGGIGELSIARSAPPRI
jgi:hypothetical protein